MAIVNSRSKISGEACLALTLSLHWDSRRIIRASVFRAPDQTFSLMMREKLTLILHQDTLERVIVIARLARDILDRSYYQRDDYFGKYEARVVQF